MNTCTVKLTWLTFTFSKSTIETLCQIPLASVVVSPLCFSFMFLVTFLYKWNYPQDERPPNDPTKVLKISNRLMSLQFFYNPGHNILALFNNLAQARIATSKTVLDI